MTLTTSLFIATSLLMAYCCWRALCRRREAFIADYRFPERLRIKLAERYPHLSTQQIQQVLTGLREYFQLCRMARRRMVAMPSQAVDVAWHEFILYTRQYRDFCNKGLGRFLHHTPNDAMPHSQAANAGIRRAWRLACARESIAPRQPTRLPLLFALDAELGIADGFIYRLDCGASGAAGAYCASHIGCSSGCAGTGCSGSGGDSGGGGGCGGGCD
ncbi:glycine-rich domain-containing protein [Pseudomonas benzenivorans]|uniref:TIGR04222 domain-containing protein n=1 Tax=Pseudomonas benzenivorans TaxID=556533 RepID=A0ABY5HEJ8_9PSED|nr:hypothetical protein [Pseudomonas benzenivorans]UTW09754.1 hypothetical protein KDW96_10810 [Pseudomonas benzenivorans]